MCISARSTTCPFIENYQNYTVITNEDKTQVKHRSEKTSSIWTNYIVESKIKPELETGLTSSSRTKY